MKTITFKNIVFLAITLILSACSKSGTSTMSDTFLTQTRGPASTPTLTLKEINFNVLEDHSLNSKIEDQLSASTSKESISNYKILEKAKFGIVELKEDGAFLYIPSLDYIGLDSFKYEVEINGKKYQNVVKINVTEQNDPPVLDQKSFIVNEDTILNDSVYASDVDSVFLTYQLVQSTSHGLITLLPTGSFVYIPTLNFFGTDSFKVKANDGLVDSETVTYTIEVKPVNDIPVAKTLTFGVDAGLIHNGQLLGSDADVADSLTYSLMSMSSKGTIVINPLTGAFIYTANVGASGEDTFSYKVSDGKASSQVVSVKAIINPVNVAPVTLPLTLETQESTPVSSELSSKTSDANGDVLLYGIISNPQHGTIQLDEQTGSFIYTPTQHYNGTDFFTYQATDGEFNSNVSVVSIVVTPVNDSPVVTDSQLTVNEDSVLVAKVEGTDADKDPLLYTVKNNPQHGTLVLNVDGTFVYAPDLNYNGIDSFTYVATDGQIQSSPATVTITVIPTNDSPLANSLNLTTNENQAVSGQLTGSDIDGDALTFVLNSSPSQGTVSLNSNGTFVYTPNNHFVGVDSFTIKSFDGQTYSIPAVVTVTVINVNDAPTTVASNLTTNEDTTLTAILTGTDLDANNLTYSLVSNPQFGTASINSVTGLLTYTPNLNFNGTDTLSFKVNDGQYDSNISTVSITVVPVNDIPVANAQTVTVNRNSSKSITLTGSDIDGDSLTYSIVTSPLKGTISGTAPNLTYTPFFNQTGADVFTFRVNDGKANSVIATVSINIVNSNNLPVTNDSSLTLNEDSSGNGQMGASDTDGDSLTYSIVSQPSHGSLTINSSTGTYVYTPSLNYNGLDTFSFKASDSFGDSYVSTISLTISPVNDAPTTSNGTLAVDEDVVTNGTVASYSNDVDGDALTYSVVSQPTKGTLSFNNSNGTYTYTPNLDYNGSDSFTFKANDGQLDSNVSTIQITIGGSNDAPVSSNGNLTLNEDSSGSSQLVATDIDGDVLTFSVVTQPTKGTVSVNSTTGTYTYTPNANANGSDSFTFKANDGQLDSNISTVSIAITPVNDAPIAQNSSINVIEDTAKNDQLVATDIDPNPLNYSLVTAPTKGTVIINPLTGAYTYTPNSNATGADSFTFKANDGTVDSNVATVAVTISNTNDAPVSSNGTLTINEDTVGNGTLTASDIDGDALTYSIVTQPTKGTLSLNSSNGTYTYTPNANANGSDSFTFKANDGTVDSNISTVSITITPVNDAPTTSNDTLAVVEDTPKNSQLIALDVDGNSLTYSVVTQPTKGTISLNSSTGNYTYTPNSNTTGADSFTFKVNDGTVDSNVSTVSVNISNTNDAPTTSNGTLTINEDTVGNGTLVASDIDGDVLTYSVVTQPTKGTVSVNPTTGAYVYTPSLNANGSDSFTFKANDGTVDSNISTVSITITPVNDAPTTSNGTLTINEDTVGNGTLIASDVDGNSLNYSVVTQPTKGTVSVNSTTGTYTYTPNSNANGSDSFTFRVNDGLLNSNTSTVSITITPINDAPTTSNGSLTINEDTVGNGTLTASDIDGNSLTYSIVTQPTKGTLSLNSSTGAYTYTPTLNANGSDSFTFKVNDGTVDSNVSTVSITITPVNDAPITSNSSLTVTEDSSNGSTLTASDVDGNSLTYSIVTQPTKGAVSLNALTGSYVYTPNANVNGTDSFTFKVNDGTVDSNISTVSITITPVNDAPVWTSPTTINLSTNVNTPVSTTLSATDIDGDTLTYSIVACANGTCNLNSTTGAFTFTPANNYSGAVSLTARCFDGTVYCSPNTTINIQVINPNVAPVANSQSLTLSIRSSSDSITLTGSDANNDSLTYSIVSNPTLGTLTGSGTNRTYTFNNNSWISCASEGGTCSFSGTKLVKYGTATNYLVVQATNGISCTNDVLSDPVVGSGKSCWYMNTTDSFTFKVNDGQVDSNTATVTINLQDWFNTNWTNRRKLVFNAQTNSDLMDFPVLVKIDNTRIDYSKTRPNGQDIRFVDSGGQLLSYEIETWNPSGISYIWVKNSIGSMEANNHYIYMYYGNLSANDAQNAAGVWSNGYVGVWHFNQTSGTVMDSLGNNNGTVAGTLTRNTSGILGNSYTNSSSSACIQVPHNSGQLLSKMTLEAWARSTTDSQTSAVIEKDIYTGSNYYWAYSMENRSGQIAETITDNSLNSTTYTTPSKNFTVNAWTYIALTYNDPTNTTVGYNNGSVNVSNTNATRGMYTGTQGSVLSLMGDCSSAGFKGSVDEVRISNVDRSADWIKNQYLSMTDGLIMYGLEQTWTTPSSILNKVSYILKINSNNDDGNNIRGLNTWNASGESGLGINWTGEENNQASYSYYRFQIPYTIPGSGVSNARLKIMGVDATNYGAWNSASHYLQIGVQQTSNASQITSVSQYPGSGLTISVSTESLWNNGSLNWNGSTWNISPNFKTALTNVSNSYTLSASNYLQLWVNRGANFNCGSSSWCQTGGADYSYDNGKSSAQLLLEY